MAYSQKNGKSALPIYQIDAFTDTVFGGNPAAVVPLTEWLPDTLMQQIAFENNLSETVFFVPASGGFHIRWFTPVYEIELCGHATLATAYSLFALENWPEDTLTFQSMSGELTVTKASDGWMYLNFPASEVQKDQPPLGLLEAVGGTPEEVLRSGKDWILLYSDEQEIRDITPNFQALSRVAARAVIVTAPGNGTHTDFVSRFFAPLGGINEDPVTGSAHTKLIPFWAKRLAKNTLVARQLSQRGGVLRCEWLQDRVRIGGQAVLYMKGEIYL